MKQLVLLLVLFIGIHCFSSIPKEQLNAKLTDIVQTLEQEVDAQNDASLWSLLSKCKRLANGELAAMQVLTNVSNVQQFASSIQDRRMAIIYVIANGVPKPRPEHDTLLFQIEQETLPSAMIDFFAQHMNTIALQMEQQSGIRLATTIIKRIPNEWYQNRTLGDMLLVYDLQQGHLYIHESFFDALDGVTGLFPIERIQDSYHHMLQWIMAYPNMTRYDMVKLILNFPILLHNMGVTIICAMCIGVLCVLTPFLLNYLLYDMAQLMCSTLHLSFEACVGLELTSLMIAYVMIYPAALAILFLCKRSICSATGGMMLKTGIVSVSAMMTYIASLF